MSVVGCQQSVVSEYTHTSLSAAQQSALVEAFGLLLKRQHNGIRLGTVLLVTEERVAGMARCVACSRVLTSYKLVWSHYAVRWSISALR